MNLILKIFSKEINPDNNILIDENGDKWTYDKLIVSCGITVNHDSIPGKKI
jgi:NADPH-dependent 2,4-dienoyl-CoA reductase/sulfur reductase-like enzyme